MTATPERPKILMLISQLGYGGAETSFIRLANYLQARMDVTIVLFTRHYGSGYSQGHEEVTPEIILLDGEQPGGRIKRWWNRWRKLRALKREHDLCISFLSGPNMLNGYTGFADKTVLSIRGTRRYDTNADPKQRWLSEKLIDPPILRRAAQTVSVSAGLRHELASYAGKQVLKRISVISPFCYPDKMFARAEEAPPEEYEILRGQPVIVGAGRVSVEKNFHCLLQVFLKVAAKVDGAKLLIVGDGPMLQQLREEIIAADISLNNLDPGMSSVIFAGYQKNPLPFMRLARVFAFPSGAEGVPNILIEALSSEALVVAADAAWGARAVLSREMDAPEDPFPTRQPTPADYGILMPRIDDPQFHDCWAAQLSECLTDTKWHEKYQPIARERVQDFSIEKVGPKWEALIHRLCNRQGD